MDGQDPAQPGNEDAPAWGGQTGGPVQPEPPAPPTPPPPAPYYAPPPPPPAPSYAPAPPLPAPDSYAPAPPPAAPYYAPPAQGEYAPPPAAKPRRTGRVLLIIGLILVLLLAALGGVAVLANASLSSTYSPEKAVTDYLAAQKRGDVNFMIANANYLKGDGSFSEYFNQGGLGALMSYSQNTDISDVKLSSTTVVDDNTRTVNLSMTWGGHQVTRAFTVHKDLTRPHYSFYYSWRVDIPFATIHVTLPNQPGTIAVDGITLPPGATHDIQVIQGFHKVTMNGTDLYDTASADADAIDSGPSVAFPSKISAAATAAAVATIKKAFTICSPAKYTDCLKHLYHSPGKPGFIYFFTLPGYGEVDYNTYVYTLTRDQTTGMHMTVLVDPGKVSVNGACAYTMTVDGSRKYYFKGTWKGTLTMSGGKFGYDLLLDCERSKA